MIYLWISILNIFLNQCIHYVILWKTEQTAILSRPNFILDYSVIETWYFLVQMEHIKVDTLYTKPYMRICSHQSGTLKLAQLWIDSYIINMFI